MKNCCFILFFLSLSVTAQLEMANWHFGSKASLDFSSGCALPNATSEVGTIESSSSISSSVGDLLFYTDGVTVYNRNDQIMTNGEGLSGELSSTNGALIIPFPNNAQRYYIFTADAVQNYQDQGAGIGLGINYSVVDMNFSGGLGEVVEKNVNILAQGSEKLTAIRHSNGIDFWVLTHYENRFYAYPITAAGVGNPIVTTIGVLITDFNNIRGVIKFSPDGSRVAVCHSLFEPALSGELALYDFNNSTGVLSNEQVLGNEIVYYGVEFSPNSQVLYTTGKIPINNGFDTGETRFYQYDLQAPNVVASRYEITSYLSSPFINLAGSIQLAIDGKIYHSLGGLRLSVVRQPNRLGDSSNFLFRAVNLGIRSASIGMPIGVQSYYENIIEYEELCAGDITSFNLNTPRAVSSVAWNFGDPDSGPSNTSNLYNPAHTFSSSGTYTVTATVTFGNGEVRTYRVNVKSVIAPELIPATLTQCDVDGENDGRTPFNLFDALDLIFLQDSNNENEFLLQFYETENDAILEQDAILSPQEYINQFNGQVIYTSIFKSLDCFQITTVTLDVDPGIDIPDLDLTVCASSLGEVSAIVLVESLLAGVIEAYPNDEIRLYPTIGDAGLQQNEISGSELFDFSTENVYYFRLGASNECIGIGKVNLTILEPLNLEDQEITLCFSENENFIEGPDGYESYEWSTGETTQNIDIDESGIYVLEVKLFAGCTAFIQYNVTQGAILEAEVSVNDFQQNNEIIIDASLTEGAILYSIDGGISFQQSGRFSDLPPGTYEVVISDDLGCNRITETVVVRGAPRFFTPNSDGYNDRWHVINALDYAGMEIEIFDRFGKRMASLTNTSLGWDGTYNGRQMPTNTYWYCIKYEGQVNYGYFTLVERNL